MNKMKRYEWKWLENKIEYEGAKSLSESLMINTSLTSLNLKCGKMKRNGKGERRNEWKGNEKITQLETKEKDH